MTHAEDILLQLREAEQTLDRFINNEEHIEAIERAAGIMADAIKGGGKIMSCGNGGSNCDAMHFAEELTGRFRENRRALPAMSLSDASHITCTANDFGFDYIFSRVVDALGKEGDVLLGISTSGNSGNVLQAAKSAKQQGMKVVALTGKDGGQMASLADVEIRVPHQGFSDRIQEIHIKVIHLLVFLIEKMVA
jgi:D-sedoheptulose 7-phosphate isomerase